MNLTEIRELNLKRINEGLLIQLPLLDEKNINFRDLRMIAMRAIILTEFKSLTIYPEDRITSLNWMKEKNIDQLLSEKEREAIERKEFTDEEKINFSWYQESLTAILWVLGFIKKLEDPINEFDVEDYVDYLPPAVSIQEYFENISTVSKENIIKELDYYYLVHHLTRRNENKFNLSVVIERRKALEWIIDKNLDWDNVSLDT